MAIVKVRDANGNVQEILAIKGEDYVLTEADKQEIAEMVMDTASIAYVGSASPTSDIGKDGDIYIVSG